MLDPETLQAKAKEDCLAHVTELLRGEFLIEPGEGGAAWNPIELRRIHTQSLVIWRKFSSVEIVSDEWGRPVGFHDRGAWKDCMYRDITPKEVLAVIPSLSFVPGPFTVLSIQPGDSGCAIASLDGPQGRYFAVINPATMKLIALEPDDGAAA